jgi:hypothetical protein
MPRHVPDVLPLPGVRASVAFPRRHDRDVMRQDAGERFSSSRERVDQVIPAAVASVERERDDPPSGVERCAARTLPGARVAGWQPAALRFPVQDLRFAFRAGLIPVEDQAADRAGVTAVQVLAGGRGDDPLHELEVLPCTALEGCQPVRVSVIEVLGDVHVPVAHALSIGG